MPNENSLKNLMPPEEVNARKTPEERRESASNAGVASGVSRRRKKSMREAANLYLSLPVSDQRRWNKLARKYIDPEDIDNQMAMIVGLTEAATKGDPSAAKVVISLLGIEDTDSEQLTRAKELLGGVDSVID